jgi:hypothetical protein
MICPLYFDELVHGKCGQLYILVILYDLRILHEAMDLSDRLCGLVLRVPGYTTEMYCASCEVRTEFIYVM